MGKINKLSDKLTNMIAAGEVVERPMGVVKELVENAIDADARNIEIRIVDGGLKSIQVIDDGVGMDKADATSSLMRHATSKIKNESDLFNIGTMGFRGEALPSIASVSKFKMLTSDGNDSTEVRVEYGDIKFAGPKAASKGTNIIVEDLFYKTPARLKHMKSAQNEANQIIDVVERFAFGFEDVSFRLYSNDVLRFESKGNGDLIEVLYNIYGKEVAKSSKLIEFEDYDFKAQAIIVMPEYTRASRQHILIYLNNRIIRNYNIQKAIINAYESYHMPDRYPICIVKINTDNKLVDVNVHPSKWEVRLSKQNQLVNLIESNIRQALRNEIELRSLPLSSKMPENREIYPTTNNYNNIKIEQETLNLVDNYQKIEYELPINEEKEEVKYSNEIKENGKLPVMRIIGQFHADYILGEAFDGLYIIDQHAAQERKNYERLLKIINQKPYPTQELIVPLTINLSSSRFNQADKIIDAIKDIGINLEVFGSNTLILREIPIWLEGMDVDSVINDLIDTLDENKRIELIDVQKELISTIACHSSIRFNRNLTLDEMKKVVDDLNSCEQPYNCPHGRPTIMKITDKDLEKEFGRE